ncbi:MAG: glycosyltransferase family 4 protein [Opitutaceae bacterium]|nr:glycosyltransferase family 4 protein [Opitutaceae bacterium]
MDNQTHDVRGLEVIAANLKRRHTGVTSTVVALLPVQARRLRIAALGPGLPADCPRTSWGRLFRQGWSRPAGHAHRIWHARRNNEMLTGWLLRAVLRLPLKLVFTSAAQRDHTRWTKFLISRMDAVIATSPESAAWLRVPHTVNLHGVDTQIYRPAADRAAEWAATGLPGRYGIGVFGRVRAQKGTDRFVDAMLALLPRYSDFTAVIVGLVTPDQRGFEAELRAKAARAGLAERIVFVGERPPAEVPLWLRRVTIAVGPQRWEGFGLVPAEAMASGTPVVATGVGAAVHLIRDAETGYLVDADDMAGLEARMETLMADPARAEAMGRAGREHIVANFSIEREAAGIERVYRRVWGETESGPIT